MNRYRLDVMIYSIVLSGFSGLLIGLLVISGGYTPVLTPALEAYFSWWPHDVLMSACIIGASVGSLLGLALIIKDLLAPPPPMPFRTYR